jgi:hypothetical protein
MTMYDPTDDPKAVIRAALNGLTDPDGDDIEKLRAAGLLAEIDDIEPMDSGALQALERRLEEWHRARGMPLGLSQSVLDKREESPW